LGLPAPAKRFEPVVNVSRILPILMKCRVAMRLGGARRAAGNSVSDELARVRGRGMWP
jgi:hypothetical protein